MSRDRQVGFVLVMFGVALVCWSLVFAFSFLTGVIFWGGFPLGAAAGIIFAIISDRAEQRKKNEHH